MPMLLVEKGNDKGISVKVEQGKTYVVGRDNPQAALKLTDPMASRQHFQISAQNGSFLLRDMKSRNGTSLNDEALPAESDVEVKIGDNIQVGDTLFSFLSDAKEESTGGGLIGKTIGGYQIIERVGRGGMGTVYKAEQISLKREVALKVLSAKLLSDPVFVEKFVQEARAAGGLIHPNIVQVIDVGSDRGIYFFSMEYLAHGSVGDIVAKEGPVPWQRALEMLTDAARGLIFAEKKGIIHQDIKPDNLMLTAEGTVKIGDLGLAKKADEAPGEGGSIFGTPHFIAPEQAQGKPIDHRADLYALGASFYRVMSGKTPFTGENVNEILIKQVKEEPVPLQKLVPDLPDELAMVVGKLMQKKPDDRYRSAQGLAEDLERIRVLYHLEGHAQAASARRNKIIAIVAVMAVFGIGGYAYHLATKPKDFQWRDRPESGKPVETGPVIVTPTVTPAELALQAFTPVQAKDVKYQIEWKGGPAQTWRQHEAEWEALAKECDAVAEKHADTPKGREAKARAAEIREQMAEAKDVETRKSEAAAAAWKTFIEKAKSLEEEGDVARAVALLDAEAKALLEAHAGFLDAKEHAEEAADLAKGAADRAAARVNPLVEQVKASAPVFPATEFVKARDALRASRTGLIPLKESTDGPSNTLRDLAKSSGEALREGDRTAREAAEAALAADRENYFRTYCGIRRFAKPLSDGAPPDPADTTPFFDFRWDACDAAWKALLPKLRTKPWQDRVARKIEIYGRCRRVLETIGRKVRDNEIRAFEFPDAVRTGASMFLDRRPDEFAKATAEGFVAIRQVGGNRPSVFVEFRAMTPREIWEGLQKEWKENAASAFTPEERLDFAIFLAEAGDGIQAYDEMSSALTADPPAKVDAGLRKWLDDETAIFFTISGEGGVLEAFANYQAARSSGMKKHEVEEIRKPLEKKIDDLFKEERFYRTDMAILYGFSLAGPDGPVPPRLLPTEVLEEVLKTLGTGAPVATDGNADGNDEENTEKQK